MSTSRTPKRAPVLRKAIQSHTRAAYQEAILDAAAAVFSRMGFVAAKIADIARETGVSVGTLYNYFPSKEAVIESLVTREHDGYLARLSELDASAPPLDRLRAMLQLSLRYAEERGALLAVAAQEGLFPRHTGQSCESPGWQLRSLTLERTVAMLTEAAAAGQIRRDVPPAQLAQALDGMLSAALFEWVRNGRKGESLRSQGETLLDIFLKGASRA
jgi:AcrR family transcriptional regulator